jgi:hypothetical protein
MPHEQEKQIEPDRALGLPRNGDDPSLAALPDVPALIAASQAAFRRALPELMKRRLKQWVAYHGDECIGFATDSAILYKECYRRELNDLEFVVRRIMPDFPPDEEITVPFDV